MGAVVSTRKKEAAPFDSYLKAIKSDKIMYLKAKASSSQPQTKEHICPRITSKVGRFFSGENKRVIYNTAWKTSMIAELKNLGNEGWPSLLLSFLKSWEHDAADLTYQSQVSWIDFNHNNSSKLIRNTNMSKLRRGSGGSKDSDSDYSPQEKEEETKNEEDGEDQEEKKLNDILYQTDLLEENFYAAHGHSSVKSSMNLQLVRDEKEEEEKKKSFARSPKSKSFVQYKNNTFILPVLPLSITSISSDHHKTHLDSLYASVNYFKLVTGLIERHLQTSTNVFNQIIAKFTEFYVNKYISILTTYSQSKEESQGEIYIRITSAVSDLQQFIRILFEGLNLFYNLEKLKIGEISTKENLFCRDNILNFLTSIVMSVPLYEQIFDLLRISDVNTEDAFQKNLAASRKMSPQEMGVPPEYCLNKRTLEFYFGSADAGLQNFRIVKEAANYQSKQKMRSPTGKANQASYRETVRFVETVMPVSGPNPLEVEDSSAERLIAEPFQKCIDNLKRIEQHRSPIHKMKTIVKTAELINASIQSFYKAFNIDKPFKLDSDQTLSIFLYIVAKAEVKSLATQIKIIEKFATSNVLNSISGYYVTTLEACISCIINIEITEEESEKNSRVEFYDNIKNYLTKSVINFGDPNKNITLRKLYSCGPLPLFRFITLQIS